MKNNRKFLPFVAILAMTVMMQSCIKEGDTTLVLPVPDGKIPYHVVPENIQDSLRIHGFRINEGIEPPMVDGRYEIAPMSLNYASDNYFNSFVDLTMHFWGQIKRGQINYSEKQVDTVMGQSYHASIIGENKDFTLYCYQVVSQIDHTGDTLYWVKTATLVSGTKEAAGIKNCQYSTIILDKWAKNDYFYAQLPEANTYRIWNDGDGMAINKD